MEREEAEAAMADSVDLRCSESASFLGSGGIGDYSGSEAPPLGAAEQWVLYEAEEEEEEEYFQMQVAKETDFEKLHPWDDDLRVARLEAVNWILDAKLTYVISFESAYLSIIYLDRFLSIRRIDNGKDWTIRLLRVACLSIAVKTQRCGFRIAEIAANDGFDCVMIERMEFLVLSALDWRLNLVTPSCYLHYLARKLVPGSIPEDLIAASIELILKSTEEMLQVDYRPSAIAVASMLVAADEIVTRDSLRNKLETISFGRSLDSDHVFAAYNLMYDLKTKTPNKMVLSPYQPKMGDDPTRTNAKKKRRVLPFDD